MGLSQTARYPKRWSSLKTSPPGELDSSDWRKNACQLNQVFCNEVRLRQSRNRQGFISWASDECGRESSTLGSDCIPDVRCNHATRGRPHVELLSNHVIYDLSWLVRACRLDAELPLKIFSETGMFEGAFATGVRRRVCQGHHAIPQLLQML